MAEICLGKCLKTVLFGAPNGGRLPEWRSAVRLVECPSRCPGAVGESDYRLPPTTTVNYHHLYRVPRLRPVVHEKIVHERAPGDPEVRALALAACLPLAR